MASSMVLVRVKCPKCGWEQNTSSVRRIKCFKCNRSFEVYPLEGKSRIVKLVRGTLQELHELAWYERFRKRKVERRL